MYDSLKTLLDQLAEMQIKPFIGYGNPDARLLIIGIGDAHVVYCNQLSRWDTRLDKEIITIRERLQYSRP